MTDTIIQPERINSAPGSPDGTIKPITGDAVTVKAKRGTEYIAASGSAYYANYWRSLPWSIDDLTATEGADLYERMQTDDQIAATVTTFKASVLEDGAHVNPAVTDQDDDGYAQAVKIQDDCETLLENLCPSLDDTLWDILGGVATGYKIAEIVWDDATVNGTQKQTISGIKVKPRESVAFVVDVFNNVVGFLARIPGVSFPVQQGTFLLAGQAIENMLPREKCAVYTFRPVNNDPRGTSILRAAYNPWYLKMLIWKEYLKYLVQCASPSVIGTTSEMQLGYVNPTTGATAEQEMVDVLIQLQNGTAVAFPYGSDVTPLIMNESGGASFQEAIGLFNKAMTTAILNQTLATMEGAPQTRQGSSAVHQDVLSTLIRQGKKGVERMIRHDILLPYVKFNYGDAASLLTPFVTLGTTEQQDKATLMASYASLGYALDASQYPAIDDELDMPVRAAPTPAEQTTPGQQPPQQGQPPNGQPMPAPQPAKPQPQQSGGDARD